MSVGVMTKGGTSILNGIEIEPGTEISEKNGVDERIHRPENFEHRTKPVRNISNRNKQSLQWFPHLVDELLASEFMIESELE